LSSQAAAPSTSDSLAAMAAASAALPASADASSPDRRRRLTYLMLYRVVLISLVLGATTLLYWLGSVDPGAPSAAGLFGIIGATYLLTLIYAIWLRSGGRVALLAHIQLAGDLFVATVLVHMTGGAQSAYTFFFPLTVIGAAVVASRRATAWVAVSAAALFLLVGVLGWIGILPPLAGQYFRSYDLSAIDLSRSLGLNMAALVGVSVLALSLSGQLAVASATLAVERSVAADLLVLHSDVVRCLSSGLVTVDPTDQVLTINQVACDILATSPEAAAGAQVDRILPGLAARLGGLDERGSLQRAELMLNLGGRELVLGVSVSPLHDRDGNFRGRVVNFQDLTELRKMEQSVRQAERLAVVGKLAAGVAHEIRNPLASISGSIELLRQAPQADEESRALMEIVTREIDRLNGLLSDLLDYSNPRSLDIEPLDLAGLVRDTIGVFSQDRGFAAVAVELVASDQLGPIEMSGDAARLRQVLWNLLRNAAEAAARGGGHVWIEVTPGSSEVTIQIRDDGPGIRSEHRERVFEPFFTTKPRGTGLGLATVHSLVSDHAGSIRFDSSASGTSFEVRLPYTGTRTS
jgi:two-component system, NtrC family, sensor histidine kinase PilS